MGDTAGGKSYRKDRERKRSSGKKTTAGASNQEVPPNKLANSLVAQSTVQLNNEADEREQMKKNQQVEKQQQDREQQERNQLERERLEREQQEREQVDREQQEREQQEREQLEQQQKEQQEREQLELYIQEAQTRINWKQSLRAANTEAAANRPDDDRHLYKLDSSLKKNTAFIRKCKTFSDGQKVQLMKEMECLNLSKYVGEVASALLEAKLKMSDIVAAVEFCSAIHQKYAEFAPSLLENWTKILSMKKDDKVINPSKLRVDLRLYSELISAGIFTPKEGLPLLGNVLTTLVAQDKESLCNVAILISFCKHCGEDYAGLTPYSVQRLADKYLKTLPHAPLLPPEKQRPVRHILKDYYSCLCRALVEVHREVAVLERGNRRQLLTRGEIASERKERAERLGQEKEKLMQNTQQMAEALGEEMIVLPVVQSEKDEEEEAELAAEITEDSLGSLWDDDDTKAFYESLPDLVAIIPSILYKDSKEEAEAERKKSEKDEKANPVEEMEDFEEDVQPDDEEVEEVNLEEEEDLQEAINLSNKMVFDAFLAQLPNCVNREMIDSAAAEFCMTHNTKVNRRRLVKALFTVQRTRTDLLPFYARLVATLHPCMPDVATQLGALLKQDFRWHVRKKDQINIESKLKICRFLGELVKFNMFPKPDILFCVKQLLFDFSHHHIEMTCAILESCGQFLFRSPETHRRTKIYLEQMLRKKAALSLDSRYVTMVENAYYLVSPPDTPTEAKRVRPPLHQYIRKLIYADLNKSNCDKILKQVRKFNWDDPELAAYIVKTLKNVWNAKYFNIRYVASTLAGLAQYHDWVATVVTDDVLEDIRMGMEVNSPKYNQRRTSMIRFLGELYNYRLLDSSLVFKVLYSLITFGVVLDHEQEPDSLDPPEHMLRLRLVCVLLDTCGQYFCSGSSKKKLDYFLLYFQRYYWFKRSNTLYADESKFPLGISNLVNETITSLRPKSKLFTSFEEACTAVQKAENEFLSLLKQKGYNTETSKQQEPPNTGDGLATISEEQEEENSLSQISGGDMSQLSGARSRSASQAVPYQEGEDWGEDGEEGERNGSRGEEEEEADDEEGGSQDREIEEELALPTAPVRLACPEDEEFLAALDRMVNENISEAKVMQRDKASISLPTAPVSSGKCKKTWEQLQKEEVDEDRSGKVQVVVMLRKGPGGGRLTKGIAVPAESQLGEQFIAREEREAREKAKLKQLTLEISERQEEEELNEAIANLQRVSAIPQSSRRAFKPQKGVPDTDAIFGSKKSAKF